MALFSWSILPLALAISNSASAIDVSQLWPLVSLCKQISEKSCFSLDFMLTSLRMYVYRNPHQQSYEAANQEIEQLVQERQLLADRLKQIEARVAQLKRHMEAIKPLLEEEPGQGIADAGITELCRDLLMRFQGPQSIEMLRNNLSVMGVDLSGYTNPGAVLHTTLRRMPGIIVSKDASGTTMYNLSEAARALPPPTGRPGSGRYRAGVNMLTYSPGSKDKK
jgi:hypothetical protein